MPLMVSLIVLLIGCRTVPPQVVVIPASKEVIRLPAGKPFTPQFNGWFVPDERMLDILNQLDQNALKK